MTETQTHRKVTLVPIGVKRNSCLGEDELEYLLYLFQFSLKRTKVEQDFLQLRPILCGRGSLSGKRLTNHETTLLLF